MTLRLDWKRGGRPTHQRHHRASSLARQPSKRTDWATKLKPAVLPLPNDHVGSFVSVVVVFRRQRLEARWILLFGGHEGPPIIIIIIEASNLDEGQGLEYQPLNESLTVEYLIRLTHSLTCLRYNSAFSPQLMIPCSPGGVTNETKRSQPGL